MNHRSRSTCPATTQATLMPRFTTRRRIHSCTGRIAGMPRIASTHQQPPGRDQSGRRAGGQEDKPAAGAGAPFPGDARETNHHLFRADSSSERAKKRVIIGKPPLAFPPLICRPLQFVCWWINGKLAIPILSASVRTGTGQLFYSM